MRKEATIKNSVAGLINRITTFTSIFLVRHYFAHYLPAEYLGIEGLFQNVLGLFSLIDMGLGTAIAFDLYEPIRKSEDKQISAIMTLYKKIYSLIGVLIFAMSVLFVPFILNFISGYSIKGSDIRFYFLVYAFGVAISYFFSYKRTLLFALQKNYIVTNVDTIVKSTGSLCQIFILVFFKNYFLYLLIIVLINITSNYIISVITDKKNYYDKKSAIKLSKQYKEKLVEHIKTLAVTNLAWQGITSTDNIIISAMTGLVDLAKNANYATIVQAINGIASSILGGVSASIGDLIAEGDSQKIKKYFDRYCFIYAVVASYAAIGVFFVSKQVITVWVGSSYILDDLSVLLISVNLYLALTFKPLADYQNYSGCFVFYKPYSIIALFINLFVSIIGAHLMGISGVFLGTTLTYLFMCFVVLKLIYRHIFNESSIDYFIKASKTIVPSIMSAFIICFLHRFITLHNVWLEMFLFVLLVTIIYFTVLFLFLRNEENFSFFVNLFFSLLHKFLKKN